MITLDLSILNQKGTPMFNSDIFANRPNFGIAGRIFISTDTLEIYRDTGSAWDLLGGGGGTISGSIAAGQVAFGTAANTIGGENNLFWDSTNDRLGIGTNVPADAIEINKNFGGGLFARIRNTNSGTGSVGGINLINDAIKTGGLYLFSSTFTPNGTRGPNTLTLFSGADTNISVAVNSTGYFSIGTGNIETEKFRIFNNGNVLLQDGGTFTDSGQRFQVTGTSNFVGNITLPLNQNLQTGLTISNSTSGVSANSFIKLQTANSSTYGEFAKLSSTYSTYKILVGGDLAIYNAAPNGDIAILNDFATGRIRFAAGGSSTTQAILFSNGNFAIGSTTDTGQRFQVVGSSLLNGSVTFSSSTGMFWDATNSRLGIGIAIPTDPLHVVGSVIAIRASLPNGDGGIFSNSSTVSNFLALTAGNLARDIGFLGKEIIFSSGNTYSERMRLFSTGNFVIASTSDTGERLQITGTAKITDTRSYTTGTIQSFAIVKNTTINSAISGSSGICNYVSTGDNGISSSQSVPDSTSFANIYAFNKYQFNSAGLTLTATQAASGIRTITQLFTQNVFKGTNSGTITHMSGVQIGGYYNDNTGSITPVITNAYQLLINDTGAYGHTFTFTNRWGIYQEGINDRNYLAGNLMLNSTTDTGQILQVNGAIRVNGQASGSAGGSSGNHLIINVDGTSYKIALLNP
jgi:hypothetical protein